LARHYREVHNWTKTEYKTHKKTKKLETQKDQKIEKNPQRECPVTGCSWVVDRFDWHFPKVHNVSKIKNAAEYAKLHEKTRLIQLEKKKALYLKTKKNNANASASARAGCKTPLE